LGTRAGQKKKGGGKKDNHRGGGGEVKKAGSIVAGSATKHITKRNVAVT